MDSLWRYTVKYMYMFSAGVNKCMSACTHEFLNVSLSDSL